jgi:hypothetical protein
MRKVMALELATANKMKFGNSKSVFLDGFPKKLLFWQRLCCIGFAFGEYLSFASPKERYQRQNCGAVLDSFSWPRSGKTGGFTKGDPGSRDSACAEQL